MKIVILDKRIKPKYATPGSAGLDLQAATFIPTVIPPGSTVMIATGIGICLRVPSVGGLVFPRSGLGHKHGIILSNGTGVIDSDYTGQLFVCAWNRGNVEWTIKPLDRIAQLVRVQLDTTPIEFVDSIEETERGDGGFGSTGK